MKQTIIFEGAGWDKADSCGDVGNCRIRGLIPTDKGIIYFEASSHEVTKYSCTTFKKLFGLGSLVGGVSHMFFLDDVESNHSPSLSPFGRKNFKWSKEGLASFIRSIPGVKPFDSIAVENGGYEVFQDAAYLEAKKQTA